MLLMFLLLVLPLMVDAMMQADTQVVLEQMNVWCQCMHGPGGATAGLVSICSFFCMLAFCMPLGPESVAVDSSKVAVVAVNR